MSLYDDLGVSENANAEEIRDAHRKAVKKHHPDKGGDPDELRKVHSAAIILRDPEKRARYDRDGSIDDGPSVDLELQGAIKIMHECFEAAVSKGAFSARDVIGHAKILARNSIREINTQIATGKSKHVEAMRLAAKLKHRGVGPNYLGEIMADKVKTISTSIENLEKNITAHERAIELLNDYEWEFENESSTYSTWTTIR